MGRTWLIPAFLLVWLCVPDAADACGCAPRSARCGPPGEFWRATAVFAGRVTAIERVGGARSTRRVRVRVLEQFRGRIDRTNGEVELFTSAVCGYPFKSGREYLVYAGLREDGRLTATICSRTTLLGQVTSDLAYARDAAAGSAPQGRIMGEVRQVPEYGSGERRLPGIPVVLAHDDVRMTTVTDALGRYAFNVAGTGTFVVTLELPGTLYLPQPERRLEIADTRACYEVDIEARFNGHLSGRVVDRTGHGVAGLTVSHTASGPRRGTPAPRTRTLTRDDGSFRLERLPPGPFVLTMDVLDDDVDSSGGDDAASLARRGTLRGGERLSLEPLVLPPAISVVHVHGSVHTTDGAPAAGARVFLKDDEEGGHIVGEPAIADSLGRFVLAVLEGERYLVFAESRPDPRTQPHPGFSVPIDVTAQAGMPPLRLTIRRGL